MKKAILTIILTSLLLPSCSGFLEETPYSQYSAKQLYQDKDALEGGLYGVYQGYRTLPLYLSIMYNAGTDIIKPYKPTSAMGQICSYSFTSEHTYFETLWENFYQIIMRANFIIDECEKADYLTDGEYRQIKSEALFLRAQAYYFLVSSWGDVPLITEALTEFDYSVGREPLSNVWYQIIEDLKYASTYGHLPESTFEGSRYRVSRYAAISLLGKAYLTMASFKETGLIDGYDQIQESVEELYRLAHDEFVEVMDFSPYDLNTNYSENFFPESKSVDVESIFDIAFGPGELGSGWTRDAFGGYGSVSGNNNPSSDLRLDGAYCGKRNLLPTGSFIQTYKEGDGRKDWNIQDFSIKLIDGEWVTAPITNTESMFIPKFRQGAWNELLKNAYGQCENNCKLIRYADILLMYAETEIKLNGGTATQKAVDAVNRIVRRARYPLTAVETPEFPDYTVSTLTFSALMEERARELCFEPVRRIDLVRTGTLEERVKASSYTGAKNNFRYYHYLFPVPAYEINITKNPEEFKQNPGYGEGNK